MATEWQRFEVPIDPAYSSEERQLIADEIIQYIQERTKRGIGVVKSGHGLALRTKEFAGYSKSYVESKNFEIAGKSAGDVNLTQSGDTLGAMQLLDDEPGKLVIGFENGTLENAIADGNIRGTYGHSKAVGPKRDFLGLTKKELADILKQHPVEDQSKRKDDVLVQQTTTQAMKLFGEEPVIPTFHGEGEVS